MGLITEWHIRNYHYVRSVAQLGFDWRETHLKIIKTMVEMDLILSVVHIRIHICSVD